MRGYKTKKKVNLFWPLLILLISITFLGGLVWIQYIASNNYRVQLITAIKELRQTDGNNLEEEKTRQEALKLRLENEQRAVFLQTLLGTLSTSVGIIVALSGIWIVFAQYINSKDRERLDRASKDLESLWNGIAKSGDAQAQAAAIAALQYFLSPNNAEHHDRVAAALALASRMRNREKIVEETLTPIIEKAMRQITNSMRNVSWQGACIKSPDFSELDLTGFDFRDSNLPEANFRNCDLTRARFDAAYLIRACFEGTILQEANLEYADLADANFRFAKLRRANFRHVCLMNIDLQEADLQGARMTISDTDWRLAKKWRTAKFSLGIREQLIVKYGPPVKGPRVLMLLWEFVPNVSGGLWTAAYHLLRNLRNNGTDVSVAVPLEGKDVSFFEFGNEIPLFTLGGENPIVAKTFTTYSDNNEDFKQHKNTNQKTPVTLGYYSSFALLEVISWFASVAIETAEQQNWKFDVIHAHDWPTFPAAKALAKQLQCPWVAHFHSTERDRQPENANHEIEQLEKEACQFATTIVTPSILTRTRLNELYAVPPEKVRVVPNCLSVENSFDRVSTKNSKAENVVFLGRLTKQKGPDYFIEIARYVKTIMKKDIYFNVYGAGNMFRELSSSSKIAKEIKHIVPDPQKIAPTEKDSLQRLCLPIQIKDIVPADYDISSNKVVPYITKSNIEQENLIEFVLSKGFIARSLERNNYYTHVIQIEGKLPDGVSAWYCIKADGLKKQEIKIISPESSFVTFNGEIPWEKRKDALKNASLVIVPSRFEPFGMVVLEAMQQGVPVLYSKSAGVGEVVKSGIKIESSAIEEVAAKIVELLEDEQKWRLHAEEALKEVAEYPQRNYEQKLIDLWLKLAKENS